MALVIDTQKALDDLVEAGFRKDQARAIIEFERQKDHSQLATREDIANLKIWFLGAMLTQTVALVALFLSLAL